MPQITLCSLAWHAPGQTHTLDPVWVAAKGPVCLFICTQNDKREGGREGNRNERKDERKGGRKTVIRSRRCLNCKWVNVTLMVEQLDRHMMELSSLTVLCQCPIKQRVRDIFCHLTSNFFGIWGHKISEIAEGNIPTPESFSVSLTLFLSHTRRQWGDQLFLFSRAARWSLIPVIPQLILVRI